MFDRRQSRLVLMVSVIGATLAAGLVPLDGITRLLGGDPTPCAIGPPAEAGSSPLLPLKSVVEEEAALRTKLAELELQVAARRAGCRSGEARP